MGFLKVSAGIGMIWIQLMHGYCQSVLSLRLGLNKKYTGRIKPNQPISKRSNSANIQC